MEDYKIDIRLGDGPKAKTMTMAIEPFTLIGATTRLGMLTAPMRARFGIEQRLNFYPADDLELIVQRTADVLKVDDRPAGATEIARRARGTPRVANRLLRRVRDFAQVRGNGVVTKSIADQALSMLDVDAFGLDDMDARILKHDHREVRRRPGGPEHDRARRSARTRTRSRRCTSRSSCSTDSCSARRADERRRGRHTNTSASSRRGRGDKRRSSERAVPGSRLMLRLMLAAGLAPTGEMSAHTRAARTSSSPK